MPLAVNTIRFAPFEQRLPPRSREIMGRGGVGGLANLNIVLGGKLAGSAQCARWSALALAFS